MQRPASSVDFPWYDSVWLSAFERARQVVLAVAPQRVEEFVHSFDVLRTSPDFEVRRLDHLFDEATLERMRDAATQLAPAQLEMHEARMFKRFVVHNHPLYTELQRSITDAVSEAASEPVEPSYNFLSLYGSHGVCPLHMDSPQAKWTVDLCLRQNAPWQIHFSPVVQWPEAGRFGEGWESEVRRSFADRRTTVALEPGDAVLFAGSSQWHYREPIPPAVGGAFCDLLFFHFIPRGTAELVEPANWATLFDIPELRLDASTG